MTEIKRALMFVNSHKPEASLLVEELRAELDRLNIEALAYPGGAADMPATDVPAADMPAAENAVSALKTLPDLAFCLGGDGTVLFAARMIAPLGVPIFPINIGTLGFIAVVHPDQWREVFEEWRRGRVGVSRRMMLDITVERRSTNAVTACCLNDAVVSASGIAKLIRLEVSSTGGALDGKTMSLGRYRSDGLIVATPTGSTAYSVAAGGPILDPEIDALIINPICPFTLSNRPIVVPACETIIVEVEAEQRGAVLLTVDGQESFPLEPGDRVFIRKTSYAAKIVASGRRGFYRALQTKLNWSGGSPNA
ncbi:MAG: NAD(+)/NADH kinase [Treponema sp.]|nr:NAD(+)/NADH kinase [Treponema sp.]